MLSVKSATFGSLENNCYLITDEKQIKALLLTVLKTAKNDEFY